MLTGEAHSSVFDEFSNQQSTSLRWSPLSFLRILWKRIIHILLTSVVLSAAVISVIQFWPATYRAETLILVDQQKIPEKFVAATVSTELQDRLATISQRILSSTRLQKIIDNLRLYEKERKNHAPEEVIEMMRSVIKVTPEKGWVQDRPGAFRVSFEGHDPIVVAQVTNQLGNLFIEENLRSRETIAEGTSDFMKTQLEEAKKHLEEQEQKLSQFKVAYNGELPQQESSLAQELSRLEVQLQGTQDAQNRANQNKITIESSLSVAQSTEATLKRLIQATDELSKRPPVALAATSPGGAAKKGSEVLEDQLAQLMIKYSPRHPDVRSLKLAIEQAKIQEAKDEATNKQATRSVEDSQTADSGTQEPVPSNPEAVRTLSAERERVVLLNAQLTSINTELNARQADQQKITRQIEDVQARLHRLPMREQEMAQVTRDYEISKANYNSLQDKIFAADMATEMERRQKSERFTVLDIAQVPQKPVRPNRRQLDGLGCAGGVAISIGFWMLIDIRKNKFLGEWELLPSVVVLGRIPTLPVGSQEVYAGAKLKA